MHLSLSRRLPIALGFLSAMFPRVAVAYSLTDSGWDCGGFIRCGSSTDAVTAITLNIIAGVGYFITALAVVMVIYGGLRMVLSRGEEGKEAGKKALIYAGFGLVAALLCGAIFQFIRGYLYLLGNGSPFIGG